MWFALGRRPTFKDLVIALYGTTEMRAPMAHFGPRFHPCERVAMALFRLGHGAGVRATSVLFDISEGWVTTHTMSVVELVMAKLGDYIKWPTPNEQDAIVQAFEERTGFK